MYLCLSSGASPRYRQDILRALAMPFGTDLQFRYRRKWLSPNTAADVAKMKDTRLRALIAYIDQTDPVRLPSLVPCRFARIVEAISLGSTVTLTLRLEGFAYASDLDAANTDLRKLATNVPEMKDGKAAGFWWTDIRELPATIQEKRDLGTWELIINQLYKHPEFAVEDLFYMIVGICAQNGDLTEAVDGRLSVKSGHDYDIQIYHYHPKTPPPKPLFFAVSATSPLIKFSTGTAAAIDSPYDLKRFRFRSDASLDDDRTVISIKTSSTEKPENVFGTDLLVTVQGKKLRYAGFGALIGISLATPTIVATLSSTAIPDESKTSVVVVSLIAGVIAGEIAAFSLKKL